LYTKFLYKKIIYVYTVNVLYIFFTNSWQQWLLGIDVDNIKLFKLPTYKLAVHKLRAAGSMELGRGPYTIDIINVFI